jgi:hypothetical protein
MSKVYSDALVKVYSRGKRTGQDVADDLHVNRLGVSSPNRQI